MGLQHVPFDSTELLGRTPRPVRRMLRDWGSLPKPEVCFQTLPALAGQNFLVFRLLRSLQPAQVLSRVRWVRDFSKARAVATWVFLLQAPTVALNCSVVVPELFLELP